MGTVLTNKERTLAGMKHIGISFPSDLSEAIKIIEDLPPEYMLRIQEAYNEESAKLSLAINNICDNICFVSCDVCSEEPLCYKPLENGWGWLDVGSSWYLMCPNCQNNYEIKYGDKPKTVTEPPWF